MKLDILVKYVSNRLQYSGIIEFTQVVFLLKISIKKLLRTGRPVCNHILVDILQRVKI